MRYPSNGEIELFGILETAKYVPPSSSEIYDGTSLSLADHGYANSTSSRNRLPPQVSSV